MKKNQLLEILNMGVINPNNSTKESLKELLELSEEKSNILLNSDPVQKEFIYYVITKINDIDRINYILDCINGISDYQLLRQILILISSEDLINSSHFDRVISLAAEIKDINIMQIFVSAVTNKSLLNSKYFDKAIDSMLIIDNLSLMHEFKDVICSQDLLNSPYYDRVITLLSKVTDVKAMAELRTITCYPNLLILKEYSKILEIFENLDQINDHYIIQTYGKIFSRIFLQEHINKSYYLSKIIDIVEKIDVNNMQSSMFFEVIDILCSIVDNINKKSPELIGLKLNVFEKSVCSTTDICITILRSDLKKCEIEFNKNKQLTKNQSEENKNLKLIDAMFKYSEDIDAILEDIGDDEDISPNTIVKTLNFKNKNNY